MREVCYFIQTPLDGRDRERLGVDRLNARGFRVRVLDMTDVLQPAYNRLVETADLSDYPLLEKARSWEDVGAFLERRRGAVGIVFMGFEKDTRRLYQLFKEKGFPYVQFCSNGAPMIRRPFSLWDISWSALSVRRVRNKLEGLLLRAFGGREEDAARPLFVTRGGTVHRPNYPGKPSETEQLWAHALDYDIYLEREDLRKGPPAEHCVFLDEYRFYHPDLVLTNLRGAVTEMDPGTYYEDVNRFLDFVEQRTGLPVAVAAHPRSRYDKIGNPYGGRRLERGRTAELVARSRFVIAHCSYSVNFAVLYGKPVVFTVTDGILRTHEGKFARILAGALGKRPLHLNHPSSWSLEGEERRDEGLYRRYKDDHIKRPGSPERPSWDIIADRLEALAP